MRKRAARAPPMRRAATNLMMAKKIKDRSLALMIVINRKKSNHQKKVDIKHIWVGKHNGLVVAESSIKEVASKGVSEQVIVFLPLDVVANMLSRLSVRSLVRFRCVCKQWRSLISDPDFIKEQRIRAVARPAIMSRRFCMQTISYYGSGDDGEIKDCSFKIKFGELPVNATMSLSNSVNGLVCGYSGSRFDSDGCHYLLNPSTRELVMLPISSQEGPEDSSVGLAFDTSTGTYKVVRLFRKKDNSKCCGCEILSVGTREWRYVGDTSCRLPCSQPVFLNGSLHWLVLCHSHPHNITPIKAILAFDIKDEKFRFMPIPKDPLVARVALFESGGQLCIVKHSRPSPPVHLHGPSGRTPVRTPVLIIWMLKDYRRDEWTEEHNIDTSSYISVSFQPFIIGIRGQEVLFEGRPQGKPSPNIYFYDLLSGIFNELYTKASHRLDLIIESLVSPKKLTGNLL